MGRMIDYPIMRKVYLEGRYPESCHIEGNTNIIILNHYNDFAYVFVNYKSWNREWYRRSRSKKVFQSSKGYYIRLYGKRFYIPEHKWMDS